MLRKLPEKIVDDIFSYNFEKMCFFYYLILKHKEKFTNFDKTYKKSNVIKEYIKSHYFSLPFGERPKPGESYYYWILEVTDTTEFYMGISEFE